MSLRIVRVLLWLPLLAFLLVLGLVASGLIRPHDVAIRSQMIGQPLPRFMLPSVRPGRPPLSNADFADGKVRLLNIFASWCGPCAIEMPILLRIGRSGVPIEGIATRDRHTDSLAFLRQYGDPYERIGDDATSAVSIAIGSSGVPETYVIDGQGIVQFQHIGPIGEQDVPDILSAVRRAR